MINAVWLFLFLLSILAAIATGKITVITETIFTSTSSAIEFSIGLAGAIAFWSGILKVAEQAGITETIAKSFQPIFTLLFPKLTNNKTALGLISMTFAANLLGLGNVATPLGIKTMEELQKINPHKNRASNEICTFLVLTLGGLCILPTTLIAIRAKSGSANPTIILGPILLITFVGTAIGLLINYLIIKLRFWHQRKE
ncbi:MAG TPA: nucleoside recognition domain-containing protein [Bacillota bacterium]|nr:nucleoside recognition domain-containing protein [Bacillota bacterium]HOL09779.1 nucleoside recognition domain-containing protein [Bacillota bacterium]HPO97325.1 nucleoside recognition domain-containing protein [Bacillota bacterium]